MGDHGDICAQPASGTQRRMGVGGRVPAYFMAPRWHFRSQLDSQRVSSPAMHPVVTGVLAAGRGHEAVDMTEPQRGY